MPCNHCGTQLGPNRTRLCKSCGFRNDKQTQTKNNASYIEPKTPAGRIARHLDNILDIIDFDTTSRYTTTDHNQIRDLKYAITDRELTQHQAKTKLESVQDQYENPNILFELRHARQYAEAYQQNQAPKAGGHAVGGEPQ